MKNFILIIWLALVVLIAKYVPHWRLPSQYDDLISASAKTVLNQQLPLQIDVFAAPQSPASALVNNFLQPLLKHMPAVEVNFIDVNQQPELIQQYGINKQGEMFVHRGEQSFHLSTLSYEAFFNGLKKMGQQADHWVVFLDKQEGKSFDTGQLDGLNQWLKALKSANYPVVILPYQQDLPLPKQVKLIILPSPMLQIEESQIDWLQMQIEQGISVLWLADPNTATQQPYLSLLFDVMRTDSYHQGHLIIKDFPSHQINNAFDRPLDLVNVMPYETSNDVLWLNDQGQVLASTQTLTNSRLMVIGDSDFLSNAFVNSGGNLEMSFRLIDWLLQQDDRIDLPSIGLHHTQLHFSKNEILFFSAMMLLIVPLLLLIVGIYFWRRNK